LSFEDPPAREKKGGPAFRGAMTKGVLAAGGQDQEGTFLSSLFKIHHLLKKGRFLTQEVGTLNAKRGKRGSTVELRPDITSCRKEGGVTLSRRKKTYGRVST